MFELAEAVAQCLDRDSARRVNRLDVAATVGARWTELQEKRFAGTLTVEEDAELAMHAVAVRFVQHLQMKARTVLRRPVNQT